MGCTSSKGVAEDIVVVRPKKQVKNKSGLKEPTVKSAPSKLKSSEVLVVPSLVVQVQDSVEKSPSLSLSSHLSESVKKIVSAKLTANILAQPMKTDVWEVNCFVSDSGAKTPDDIVDLITAFVDTHPEKDTYPDPADFTDLKGKLQQGAIGVVRKASRKSVNYLIKSLTVPGYVDYNSQRVQWGTFSEVTSVWNELHILTTNWDKPHNRGKSANLCWAEYVWFAEKRFKHKDYSKADATELEIVIAMPLMSPVDDIRDTGKWSAANAKKLFYGALKGVKQLHAMGFVHLDIKPANMVMNSVTDEGMLIDFGLCQAIRQDKSVAPLGGTVPFSAPETLLFAAYMIKIGDLACDQLAARAEEITRKAVTPAEIVTKATQDIIKDAGGPIPTVTPTCDYFSVFAAIYEWVYLRWVYDISAYKSVFWDLHKAWYVKHKSKTLDPISEILWTDPANGLEKPPKALVDAMKANFSANGRWTDDGFDAALNKLFNTDNGFGFKSRSLGGPREQDPDWIRRVVLKARRMALDYGLWWDRNGPAALKHPKTPVAMLLMHYTHHLFARPEVSATVAGSVIDVYDRLKKQGIVAVGQLPTSRADPRWDSLALPIGLRNTLTRSSALADL